MSLQNETRPFELYSTCPQSSRVDAAEYRDRVIEVSRWSEEAGCAGMLIYTDNSLVDPWQVAQIVIENTERLTPLIAVQPIYMHPYWVAKQIASLGVMYGRRVALNLLAGGFKNDLIALGDDTPHDRRYDRMVEYATIVAELLKSDKPVTFKGDFYQVENLHLAPSLPAELTPGVLASGSSDAGRAAAATLGASAISYPRPVDELEAEPKAEQPSGIRVGMICREDADEAWAIARARFPEDRRGQILHQMAMKVSDSAWHRQLSEISGADAEETGKNEPSVYWMVPFHNYKTFCPYLVGDYDQVAEELARYFALGYTDLITDIPVEADDLRHANIAIERARKEAGLERAVAPLGL